MSLKDPKERDKTKNKIHLLPLSLATAPTPSSEN